MSLKRLMEIRRRKQELDSSLNTLSGAELDNAIKEVDALEKEETELRAKMKEAEDVEKRGLQIAMPGQNAEPKVYGADSPEYRSAFYKKMAGVELNDVEKRAMSTNSNSAGAAVPTTTLNKIYEKIAKRSILYSMVTVMHLNGNVSIPIEGTTNDVQRKGEGVDGDYQNDTLSAIELGAKKYIKLVKLTCELANTSIDALEDFVVNQISKKFADAIDEDIANGTGTNGAKGILKTITPLETATADKLTYDDVCDLFAAVPANAKKNAKIVASTNTLYKRIAKVKDDVKRPIFDVEHQTVLGRHVEECDSIPDDVILFGDFEAYMFNWNKPLEIRKSEEAAFASGDLAFRGLALADGKLAELGSMKALKIKEQEETPTPSTEPSTEPSTTPSGE